ncbi:MAG: nucleotidyltransferase domain-containing protein [Candidatus Firestonebacteria bacterium]
MLKKDVIKAIQFLERCLIKSGVNISKIIMFGSYAKGNVTKESDVDIIILSDDFNGKDIFERANITKEAEIKTIKKFLIPFDIITLTTGEFKEGLFSKFVKSGGVTYSRK